MRGLASGSLQAVVIYCLGGLSLFCFTVTIGVPHKQYSLKGQVWRTCRNRNWWFEGTGWNWKLKVSHFCSLLLKVAQSPSWEGLAYAYGCNQGTICILLLRIWIVKCSQVRRQWSWSQARSWAGRWLTLQCGNFCSNSTYIVGECKFQQQEGPDTRHLKTTWYLILLCLKANITLNVGTKFRLLGWDVVKQN